MHQPVSVARVRDVRNASHILMRLQVDLTDEERRHISRKCGAFSFTAETVYRLGPEAVNELLRDLIALATSTRPRERTQRDGMSAEVTKARGIAAILARLHEFPLLCMVNNENVAEYTADYPLPPTKSRISSGRSSVARRSWNSRATLSRANSPAEVTARPDT